MSGASGVKRKKIWLVCSAIAFALWIGAMLLMYFLTVYPERHPGAGPSGQPASEPTEPAKLGLLDQKPSDRIQLTSFQPFSKPRGFSPRA
jgi:hypothetical protein